MKNEIYKIKQINIIFDNTDYFYNHPIKINYIDKLVTIIQ
jgi:hypothetical protein